MAASEDGGQVGIIARRARGGSGQQQRRSSNHRRRHSHNLEAANGGHRGQQGPQQLKKGYNCCSKREKSSALAALIGCVSLASLMTGLVADLWVNTDEWVPSVSRTNAEQPEQPQVQPRHEEGSRGSSAEIVQRIHFAVGLWTVCPSYQDGRDHLNGKP